MRAQKRVIVDSPTYSDGSDRQAKPQQIAALDWLSRTEETHVRVILGPTGAGKSFLAMARAKPGTVILVPDNIQLDQYMANYKHINRLKGREHYEDEDEYKEAKLRLWRGDITVTNLHSWYFFQKFYYSDLYPRGPFNQLIIDEFHNAVNQLRDMNSGMFTRKRFPDLPLTDNPRELIQFFGKATARLQAEIAEESRLDKKIKLVREKERIALIREGFERSSSDYVVDVQPMGVSLKRYEPDDEILVHYTSAPRIILMSATPRPSDCRLFSKNAKVFEMASDIPVSHREIIYVSSGYQMNKDTTVAEIKPAIQDILKKHRGQNGVIHVPYWRQEEFRKHFPDFIYHDQRTKSKALAHFKKHGGVLVASGCSEGIDLPDDQCRFQIIPWVIKPSLGDLWVRCRQAKADGQQWYEWEALVTFAQMAGRSTRGPSDFSTVYTFDPYIYRLYQKYKRDLWSWFSKALNFTQGHKK
jgi:Rad3-related DNA helicase